MTAADLSNLVVEVLHNRGDDNRPDWSVGSGFFVDTKLVLTALHNVDGPGELLVRVHGTEEYQAKVCLQGDKDIVDLAVLDVSDVSVDVPLLHYGAVDRTVLAVVKECQAVGFPRFKERVHDPKPLRLSAQVDGEIPTGENLDHPLLTLRVRASPRPLPKGAVGESEWAGMSGAPVFTGKNIIVGVITEHHLPEGESALTVVPITAINLLPETVKWWKLLGVDHQALVRLPSEEAARIQYLEKTSGRYGSVELPIGRGTSKSFPLQVVFQPLKLRRNPLLAENLEQEERRAFQDEPENDESGASNTSSNIDNGQSFNVLSQTSPSETVKDGEEALKESPQKRMIVLGGPGTGKTTLLRHLVSQYAKRAEKDPYAPVPVFIPLIKLALSGKTLKEYITSIVQDMIVDEHYAHVLWKVIEEGRALVCLDGLDEVIDQREDIVSKINSLISHTGNICVVSSRFTRFRTGEQLDPQKLTMWELLPLDDTLRLELARHLQPAMQQLQAAFNTRFAYDPSEFIKTLEQYKRVATWGKTPLLFSLAAVVFTRTGMLPSTNAGLYEQVTEGILQMREPNATSAAIRLFHRALAALALELCLQKKGRMFTSSDLLDILPKIRKERDEYWGTVEMINRITNSGVVEVVAQDTFGFIHQTFQEYLAAKHVMWLPKKKAERVIDLLLNSISEPLCNQVFIEIVHMAHQQKSKLEDICYHKVLALHGSMKAKIDSLPLEERLGVASTSNWGVMYLLLNLLDDWFPLMRITLENGSNEHQEDVGIASTIGSVFELNPQPYMVPILITCMSKYEKRARFIGALGKIGTDQAKDALVTFTQEQLEHATDPGVFRYLAKALGEAHVKQAVPLLRNILKDSRLPKAAQREANHALWCLGQEEEVEGMQYDKLTDLLADLSPVDEKGRPSDWQIVEEAATWVLHQAQSSLVQSHLTEVLAALEKALYHPYEPARIPVVRALGELGNSQTFVYFMLRLIDQHEPHIVAKEVLRALTRLAERNQVNLEIGKYVSAWFSQIQQADPMLADEVSRTKRATQKSLEDRKEER